MEVKNRTTPSQTPHDAHQAQQPQQHDKGHHPATPFDPNDHHHIRREAYKGTFRHISNLLFGIGMGVGLPLSGMISSTVANGLFDASIWFTGRQAAFRPDLAVVFGSALVVHGVLFWGVAKKMMSKPLLGNAFHIPTNKIIDKQLVLGSALFGAGWALSGLCPGPAMVASFSGNHVAVLTASTMFLGFAGVHFWRSFKEYSAHHVGGWNGLATAIAQHGTLEYIAALGAILGMNWMWKAHVSVPVVSVLGEGMWTRVLGGTIIGSSIGLAMIMNGQILGNSGIIGGLVNPQATDKWIRLLYVLGLGVGSLAAQRYLGIDLDTDVTPSIKHAIGGLMFGAGAALANGCTSGHGVAGVTRFSVRSLVATATFMSAAVGVASFLQQATL